jgi:hypothetical protein
MDHRTVENCRVQSTEFLEKNPVFLLKIRYQKPSGENPVCLEKYPVFLEKNPVLIPLLTDPDSRLLLEAVLKHRSLSAKAHATASICNRSAKQPFACRRSVLGVWAGRKPSLSVPSCGTSAWRSNCLAGPRPCRCSRAQRGFSTFATRTTRMPSQPEERRCTSEKFCADRGIQANLHTSHFVKSIRSVWAGAAEAAAALSSSAAAGRNTFGGGPALAGAALSLNTRVITTSHEFTIKSNQRLQRFGVILGFDCGDKIVLFVDQFIEHQCCTTVTI